MKIKISIIGAAGNMGSWMCRYFVGTKYDVTGYDEDESKDLGKSVTKGSSLVGAILGVDYVILCTPTRKTPEIIRLIAKEMKRDAYLIDISSQKLKTASSLSRVPAKIIPICIHPMFGNGVKTPKGQNIISIPIRDGKKELTIVKMLFPEATFVTIDSTEHDKRIATILGLTHLVNLVYASIISKDEKSSLTYKMSSSTFRVQKTLADSIMADTPDLIESIISNPQLRRTAEELWKDIGRLLSSIQEKKSEEITDYVKACQARIEANADTSKSRKKMTVMSRTLDRLSKDTSATKDSTKLDKRVAALLGLTYLVNLVYASITSKDEKPSLTYKMSSSTFRIQKTLADSIMINTPNTIESIISHPHLRKTAEELWKDIGRLLSAVQEHKSEEITDYVKACQERIYANGGTEESYKKMIAMSRKLDK